jgi:antitoxin component YwqK of YwqJK toxin-antitoxin module
MKQIISLAIIWTLILTSCNGQTEEKEIEKATKEALKEWSENPSINNESLDPTIIEQFQDSGQIESGLKEGVWIEYSLDSSIMGQTTTLGVGDKQVPMTFEVILLKEIGAYYKDKREGIWTTYDSGNKKPPFYWNRKVVIRYKDGKKHGKEINYHGYGEKYQNPFLIQHWKNNIEHGIGKMYYTNHPYNLHQVYNAIDGQMWLLEKYYPDGQLQTKIIDTTIAEQEVKYTQSYYESGQLKQTGYYINGKDVFGKWIDYYENGQIESIENYERNKLDGLYQYYHDNGQLWTEKTYKNGRIWNVHSNFDRNGKEKSKGTIKDGTGTLKRYDNEGILIDSIEYQDGQEIKK